MNTTHLAKKNCVPCQGGLPSFDKATAGTFLAELGANWKINEAGHLYKLYTFRDFMQSFDFAHKIALIAEQEGHHPRLTIAWGSCEVEIWTHKINGLTESDFILAAKIEEIP